MTYNDDLHRAIHRAIGQFVKENPDATPAVVIDAQCQLLLQAMAWWTDSEEELVERFEMTVEAMREELSVTFRTLHDEPAWAIATASDRAN
jgi:hypothetical protein